MPNFDPETLKLAGAIPTDAIYSECPLAFDASGWQKEHFGVVAMNGLVAKALKDGNQHVAPEVKKQLARQANFNDPTRMGEYAACLLRRASGTCMWYDAKTGRERDPEEAMEFLSTKEQTDV